MNKVNLVLDCENEKPNSYPQKANKCFTGWYTKDESGNETEVEWPALITSSTKIYPKYENETPGLSYTYTGDGYAIVGGYNGSTADIFVPDIHNDGTHGNAKITSIADNAFSGNTNMISLTVPNTIITIGNSAFYRCDKLTTVFIPKSVQLISNNVFAACNSITSIVVEEGNPVYDSRSNCNAIIETATDTLITGCNYTIIPNGVKILDYECFNIMKIMTELVIPDSVVQIGYQAFSNCNNLTKVTLSSNLQRIDMNAFNSNNIEELYIPATCIYIGKAAFMGNENLKKIVVDPTNTKYDSRNNCNAIIETATSILITGCINTIIPDTVETIGYRAFYGLTALSKLTISKSVKAIDATAFTRCIGIEKIEVDDANVTFDSRNECNAIIETKTNTLIFGCKNTVIDNTITTIGQSAFERIGTLTAIAIPNNVKKICKNAFYGSGLISITIPSSVETIEEQVFSYCNNLQSISVDNANTTYDSRNGCNAIIEKSSNTLIAGCKTSTIPNTVTAIGNYAFHYISSLTSINLSDSVVSIGENAFYACTKLSQVTLSSNLVTIGNRAFRDCLALENLIIPDSVTYIGYQAFLNLASLKNVEFKNSSNWKVYDNAEYTNGESIEISNTDYFINATILKSIYVNKWWKRG